MLSNTIIPKIEVCKDMSISDVDDLNNSCAILMLHSVSDKKFMMPINKAINISPEYLESFIIKAKEKNYNFITLDKLCQLLKNGDYQELKKNIVITLDDGYKNNFSEAFPIFKKHDVPFAIYISTSFLNQKAFLWWFLLEEIIIKNETLKIDNKTYICETHEEKVILFDKLKKMFLSESSNIRLNFEDKLKDYLLLNQNPVLLMNWDELKEMSDSHLCTIASHTVNHPSLSKLSDTEIKEEVLGAINEIETKLKIKINHFAYPFGAKDNCSLREFKIIEGIGVIKTATTTERKNIDFNDNFFALPRIMLCETKQSKY